MAQVRFNNIGKTYPNGVEALKPTDFDIKQGEFAVLVGPSGCGKSTLLRMVAGLEEITSGELSIAGRIVNAIDPADRDIAMVFQNYALYPHMSVRKNIGYGLRNRGISKTEIAGKVAEAATLLNLSDHLDRKPSQLSGGQRQRVAMGRAIVRDPALFLFDEPLSNLDAKLRHQMRIEIKALQRRLGVTSIYVTHDQVEAMTMADRIIVMNAGRIEQIGTPAEVYHDPASTFVAAFMGAPPMNLLRSGAESGKLYLNGGALCETAHEGEVVAGVRPEDFLPDPEGVISMQVDIVEELGAHRLLHGKIGQDTVTVHVGNEFAAKTGPLRLSVKPGAVCLFDADTGYRI
ncbi:ABC transporter ATP-binding protein [Roseovarius sp. SYSU LYC5161]|uniref:ABC transporter ATP-binding protein n=1 Tax=Roseovarius halophilus (ex Wu et al. 2025) TaxID=3376060 RepID=UPI00399A7AA0